MGTFDKNRGLHVLAKAWPKVRKTVPSARLWVIGGDIYNGNSSQIAYIEKVKKNLGESIHSVYFTGILGKEKEYYLGQSKLAVLNPYGYEALPVTGIEFLNAGLPIVTIKKNGQKEVVKDKYNGLFCKNHRSLADKIILLLENEEMQKEMSENAVKTADTIFNKERFEKNGLKF